MLEKQRTKRAWNRMAGWKTERQQAGHVDNWRDQRMYFVFDCVYVESVTALNEKITASLGPDNTSLSDCHFIYMDLASQSIHSPLVFLPLCLSPKSFLGDRCVQLHLDLDWVDPNQSKSCNKKKHTSLITIAVYVLIIHSILNSDS